MTNDTKSNLLISAGNREASESQIAHTHETQHQHEVPSQDASYATIMHWKMRSGSDSPPSTISPAIAVQHLPKQIALKLESSLHTSTKATSLSPSVPKIRSGTLQAPINIETVPVPGRVRVVPESLEGKKITPRSSLSNIASSRYLRECESAAVASRLPPRYMSTSENSLMKDHLSHLQITTYILIRNGILRLWVKNPLLWVTVEEAQGVAREERHFALSRQIWEFLVRNGYINFGCLSVPRPIISSREQRNIIIVGAGIAGLTAARQLEYLFSTFHEQLQYDYKIVVLESRSRIGGRVYSHSLGSKRVHSSSRVDLGAQIVTGFSGGNPLTIVLQRQLACPHHPLIHARNNKLHGEDGHVISPEQDLRVEGLFNFLLETAARKRRPENPMAHPANLAPSKRKFDHELTNSSSIDSQCDQAVVVDKVLGIKQVKAFHEEVTQSAPVDELRRLGYHVFNNARFPALAKLSSLGLTMTSILQACCGIADISIADRNILQWHWANMEYACGTNLDNLSLEHWDQDDGNEFRGNHAMIVGGYSRLARGLALAPEALDVRTSHIVTSITPNEVFLSCGRAIPAEKVIVSVPLGVLKAEAIQFLPSLPDWKLKSIRDLGYGLLNKVVLVYDRQFWASDLDLIGSAPTTGQCSDIDRDRGKFYMFWNCTRPAGGRPVLTALMAGDAAFACENDVEKELVADATALLQAMYPQIDVPPPSEYIITKWSQDPFSRGSYSYIGPNASGLDYDALAKPVQDHWYFAGEATCRTHPSTVHGAFLSGLAVARDVLDSIIGRQTIPKNIPLIPSKPRPGSQSLPHSMTIAGQLEDTRREFARLHEDGSNSLIQIQAPNADRKMNDLDQITIERHGPKPVRPKRTNANPFLVFQKDQWNNCRDVADNIQRKKQNNAGAKATKNQIRACLGQTWRDTSASEKQHWVGIVNERKAAYEIELLECESSLAQWEAARAAIATGLSASTGVQGTISEKVDHSQQSHIPDREIESRLGSVSEEDSDS